jgi:hypothetical protein
MGARFQTLHAMWREASKASKTHTCAFAQVQLHSCHRHESAYRYQQQTAKKLTGVNKMNYERFVPAMFGVLSTIGLMVGFNGDGGLHKLCLVASGVCLGFLIEVVTTTGDE